MQTRYQKLFLKIPFEFLLLLVAILAFWQLAFLQNGLQWDIQDAMLPWRYHAGESLQNGIFPLWNPYQQFGFPIHADLQYTNWSAEVWIIGNLFGYSLYTIYFLIFFYVWMAGLGMYKLANYFNSDKRIAFFIGCCFMLSGCVIAHMQQFVVIIGIAWLPFVCWQFFELIEHLKWKNVFGFCAFVYLLICSGYQALAFMLFYFFIAVVIFKIYEWMKDRNIKKIISFSYKIIFTISLLFILLLPIFVSVYQSAPYVHRLSKGVSIAEAQLSPFSPQSLISLFLPVAAAKDSILLKTDLSCANIFFGFIPFALFLFSLSFKKSFLQKIILFFILLFTFASFGEYMPIRKALFDFVPLMNLFRLPGLFRIVVLLLILIQLSICLKSEVNLEKKFKFIFTFSSVIYLAVVIVSFLFLNKQELFFLKNLTDPYTAFHSASTLELVFFESLIFCIISFFGLFYIYNKKEKWNWQTLSFLSILSLIVGVQFNIYFNIASENSPSYVQSWINELPKGYPLPAKNSVSEYSPYNKLPANIYRNTGCFLKKPMLNDYSSYRFDALNNLSDSFINVYKQFLYYPIAYLSDSVAILNESKNFTTKELPVKKITFLTQKNNALKKIQLKINKSDTFACNIFRPDFFEYNIRVSNRVIFNILQSDYIGWFIKDNGELVNDSCVIKNAGLFLSVILEKGRHTLTFQYKNNIFMGVYWFSLALFFFSLAIFLFLQKNEASYFGIFILAFVGALSCYCFNTKKADNNFSYSFNPKLHTQYLLAKAVIEENIYKRNFLKKSDDTTVFFCADNLTDRKQIFQIINSTSKSQFVYNWLGKNPDVQIIEYILHYFPVKEFQTVGLNPNCGQIVFSNKNVLYDFKNVYEHNDINNADYWVDSHTKKIKDSLNPKKFISVIDSANPYSPNFIANAYTLFSSDVVALRFSFQINSPNFFKYNVHVFYMLNNVIKKEVVIPIEEYFINKLDWNYVTLSIKPDLKIKKEMQVKIFLINNSKGSLLMKDLRIETLLK